PDVMALGTSGGGGMSSLEQIALSALKLQQVAMEVLSRQSTTVVEQFTQVMAQASTMMNAAHGIGLTTRPPRVVELDEEDDDDVDEPADIEVEVPQQTTAQGFDVVRVLGNLVAAAKAAGPLLIPLVEKHAPQAVPYLVMLGITASATAASVPAVPVVRAP